MERRLSHARDRGAMRLVTLGRLVAFLAIVGILGYDGFAVMSSRVSTENDAQNAAYAASQAWHNDPNISLAFQAAAAAMPSDETVLQRGFSVDQDGTIHLLVQRTVKTIFFSRSHIASLKKLDITIEHGDANSVN